MRAMTLVWLSIKQSWLKNTKFIAFNLCISIKYITFAEESN